MRSFLKTALAVCSVFMFIYSGCGKKEALAQQFTNQDVQPTSESTDSPEADTATYSKKDIKADTVLIVRGGVTKVMGGRGIMIPLGAGGNTQPAEVMMGPVKVMIIREIAPEDIEAAKKSGFHVGGAYIQKSSMEYEYIRDVDLWKPDVTLANEFGLYYAGDEYHFLIKPLP